MSVSNRVKFLLLPHSTLALFYANFGGKIYIGNVGGLCIRLNTRLGESIKFGASECDRVASIMRRPGPLAAVASFGGKH
jgi:hypothetical protein